MPSDEDPSTLQKLCGIFQPNNHGLLLIRRLNLNCIDDFDVYKHLFSHANMPPKINLFSKERTKACLPEKKKRKKKTGTHWCLLLLTKLGGCW